MTIHHPAKWNEYLTSTNTDQIWKELNRIVGQHKLTRYSPKFDQLLDEGKFTKYTDLTQDLFLSLLEKNRFDHYLKTHMTDSQIEMEISQIELTNLLTLELRKRYPEAYRLSRRISRLLQSQFKRFDKESHKRLSDQVYGLIHWDLKEGRFLPNIEESISRIPYY